MANRSTVDALAEAIYCAVLRPMREKYPLSSGVPAFSGAPKDTKAFYRKCARAAIEHMAKKATPVIHYNTFFGPT